METIVVDTSAAVEYLRSDGNAPPILDEITRISLPVTVVGELYAGAFASDRQAENLAKVRDLTRAWDVLPPTLATSEIYGRIRQRMRGILRPSKLNDLWIAALCLEHNLPLLTNDHGFDHISGLAVVHW